MQDRYGTEIERQYQSQYDAGRSETDSYTIPANKQVKSEYNEKPIKKQ